MKSLELVLLPMLELEFDSQELFKFEKFILVCPGTNRTFILTSDTNISCNSCFISWIDSVKCCPLSNSKAIE